MNITFASKKGLSLITVGVIALGSASKDVRQHVTALFNGAHKTLEGFASDDHLLRVLTEQVEDAQKTIRKGDLLVKRHSDRAASLETELTRLRSAGETARARLVVLRPAVEAKDGILLNSVRYTSDEVLREANALVAAVADAQREEGVRNTELKAEKERIAAARGSLEKARTQLAELQTKTRDMELRLASARAGVEARSLVKNLNDEFKSQVEGGASHTLAVLEERIADMEMEGAEATAAEAPQGVVQWDTQPATSERIKAILSTGTVVVSSDSTCRSGN